jgi:hypothetical protein
VRRKVIWPAETASSAPRCAVAVVLILWHYPRGATYRGLSFALGIRSRSAIRRAVQYAQAHELVRVSYAGARGDALITLTPSAKALLRKAGIRDV